MTLFIKSPKATQVKFVGADFNSRVSAGDLLFELYDYEERAILSEIDRSMAENEARMAELDGVFVTSKVASLNEITTHRDTALQVAQVVYEAVLSEYEVGQKTLLDVIKVRQDIPLRSYQILQSAIEAEIYSRNLQDSRQVFSHVSGLLAKEREYVEKCIGRLQIVAPANGIFTRFVSAGTPVRVGHLLGQID
ncbi:hypothetical protein GOD71_32845 [Sinorhizobium medicae]|nr:hypothetical protein [Sinorhizobium medicae]MDX0507066.1 hypothetical protein [Sinorhizobium medicae]MDX0593547.1 hypothetical protein [Sinorhizobium medicae]MDX0648842.1 hypothetical protein [Sinorhizobium medicae]MDX0742142.1 hypothetical protein [Sinorhizobium medicae]